MSYTFKPKLLPTFVFLLVFPALIALGFWQLERAEQKKNWLTALDQQENLTLDQVLAHPTDALYHHIELEGEFLPTPTLVLAHQSQNGKHGVDVVNLFQLKDNQGIVLVDRGFLGDQNPTDLPDAPGQRMLLHGIIDRPKPDRFILGSNILNPAARPLIVQRLDEHEIGKLIDLPLLPFIVLATDDLNDGLIRQWQITPRMPPEKHLGYAIQWFALALCLVVIYIVVNLKKRPV